MVARGFKPYKGRASLAANYAGAAMWVQALLQIPNMVLSSQDAMNAKQGRNSQQVRLASLCLSFQPAAGRRSRALL